jgi:UDP-N-acetylmuramate--alanine ligase
VTNIEADHMDHYESLAEIEAVFGEFVGRTAEDGTVVVSGDDSRATEVVAASGREVVTYGFADSCDVRCIAGARTGLGYEFEVVLPGGRQIACRTCVPGLHMVSNATAALATAHALGLDMDLAAAALASFTGVRRRFDLVGEAAGVTVVDDYAHHPTEIGATVGAASELGYSRVWALFQPHRYSRTQAFAHEFGDAFAGADRVVLMDVYSAGESPIPGVGGRTVLESLLGRHPRAQAAYLPHRADIVPYLAQRVAPGDLVMTLGAGDVTSIGPQLIAKLSETQTMAGEATCP